MGVLSSMYTTSKWLSEGGTGRPVVGQGVENEPSDEEAREEGRRVSNKR